MNKIDAHIQLGTTIEDFAGRVILTIKRNNMPRITVLDLKINSACAFVNAAQKIKIVSIGLNTFRRFVNAEVKCPIKKVKTNVEKST